jgi:hypothetical protein
MKVIKNDNDEIVGANHSINIDNMIFWFSLSVIIDRVDCLCTSDVETTEGYRYIPKQIVPESVISEYKRELSKLAETNDFWKPVVDNVYIPILSL